MDNNLRFQDTLHSTYGAVHGQSLIYLFKNFLESEYQPHEMPTVKFQEVKRKKDMAGVADKYITFDVIQPSPSGT